MRLQVINGWLTDLSSHLQNPIGSQATLEETIYFLEIELKRVDLQYQFVCGRSCFNPNNTDIECKKHYLFLVTNQMTFSSLSLVWEFENSKSKPLLPYKSFLSDLSWCMHWHFSHNIWLKFVTSCLMFLFLRRVHGTSWNLFQKI